MSRFAKFAGLIFIGPATGFEARKGFLLRIVAKLFGPTFCDEKVGLDNFRIGLRSSRVLFSLAQRPDSRQEKVSCFESLPSYSIQPFSMKRLYWVTFESVCEARGPDFHWPSDRIRGKKGFLLQIVAKLSDPTFRAEKVGPDNL